MKHLQNEHEWMTQNYNKVEQSHMQLEKIIKGLEQTCKEVKEQWWLPILSLKNKPKPWMLRSKIGKAN